MHICSLEEARKFLPTLMSRHKSVASIHSLGALHEGHGKVIDIAVSENDCTIVTLYPNKAQLALNSTYDFDLEKDIQFCYSRGATCIITPQDNEMYPKDYRTFLNQGDCYQRLDGSVLPYLFPGMITMSFRWLLFVRPHVSYFGMKDIGQVILVKRAVKDLMVDCRIREVPCVRYKCGVPISSRLLKLDKKNFMEVTEIYRAIDQARKIISAGDLRSDKIIKYIEDYLKDKLVQFKLVYAKIVEPIDFHPLDTITIPFILHCVIFNGSINHFDGIYIRNEEELLNGPDTIWLDKDDPFS